MSIHACGSGMPPIDAAAATDQRRMSPRRDSGRPSTREIAHTGNGSAKSVQEVDVRAVGQGGGELLGRLAHQRLHPGQRLGR